MEDMWTRLRQRARETESRSILSLFEHSKDRFAAFSAQCGDVLVDISKTNIDRQTLALLIDLAKGRGVAGRRDAMFRGDAINVTENRAVLHWALRADDDAVVRTGGVDVMPQIVETRECLNIFASKIRSGDIRATGGEGFTDIINIGIGGSDLGPAMAVAALSPYHDGPRCHFVSIVDAADISGVLGECKAQTTLVNIADLHRQCGREDA
ncbi:MAG: glucose-6-phosphate isomerase, partial [Paracoccaceae bacterium]